MSTRFLRSFDQVEAACDRVVSDAGGTVVQLRRVRGVRDGRSQSEGLPSRRYRVCGAAFWWFVKADRGRLSDAQSAFLIDEHSHGSMCGAGDDEALRDVVRTLRKHPALANISAWEHAKRVAERGREMDAMQHG
jgi:hypothetical protein